jgi:hypothetical protein
MSRDEYAHVVAAAREQVQREVRRTRRRARVKKAVGVAHTHRRRWMPVAVAAAVMVASLVLAAGGRGGWRTVLVAAGLAGGAVAWKVRRRERRGDPMRRAHMLYLAGLVGYASLWLLVAVLAGGGFTPPLPIFWLAGLLGFGGAWWWHHRIRPDAPAGDAETIWTENVAADGGPLPRSGLAEVRPDTDSWRGLVVLPRGRLATSNAIAATEMVASAYAVPVTNVSIEATPNGESNLARITVYQRNPLREVRPFPGPLAVFDPVRGQSTIGVYHDGEPVPYVWWQPGSGPVHDLISGTTGAGKSQLVGGLLAVEHATDLIVSWVIDPQRGQSLPEWQEAADWFAPSVKAGMRMLRALARDIDRRNAYLSRLRWTDDKGRARRGKSWFDPTPELPIISVTIEEAHMVFGDPIYGAEAVTLVEKMSKIARKCGVRFRIITQVPLLDQLGNSSTLRSMVASGNVIVLRTADRLSGQVAFNGALPVDPAGLPRMWPDGTTTAGLGFVLGGASRAATMRGWYVEDPFHWATQPRAGQLSDIDIAAAGPDYASWRARYELDLDDMDAPTPAGSGGTPEAAAAAVAPAPAVETPNGEHGAAGARSPGTARSGTARQAVLDYLRQRGETRSGVIADRLDIPHPTVCTTLARLEADQLARRIRHGVWAPRDPDDIEIAADRDEVVA